MERGGQRGEDLNTGCRYCLPGRIDRYESRAIHAMLTKAGWVLQEWSKKVAFYGQQRVYKRTE